MALEFKEKSSIESVLERLASKPKIAGLAISDTAIQYVVYEGSKAKTVSLKVPPGIIQNGKILKEDELVMLLKTLRTEVDPKRTVPMLPVVLVVPSSIVFVQSFRIPKGISSSDNEKAAVLNMQMLSPVDVAGAYMSHELIEESADGVEFLGAIAEKSVIDAYSGALEKALWYAVAVEFPARSLSRLVEYDKKSTDTALLLVHVASDGIGLSLLRKKRLVFNYFHSWASIQGAERQILMSDFENALEEQIRRVMNFCFTRFSESLGNVAVIAPGVEDDVVRVVKKNPSLGIVNVLEFEAGITPVWYVPLGAAYRGRASRRTDDAVSVGGVRSRNIYYAEQLLQFVRLWRNVLIVTGAILLFVFGGVHMIIGGTEDKLLATINDFQSSGYTEDLKTLQSKVEDFNTLVNQVEGIRAGEKSLYGVYKEFQSVATKMNVKFESFNISNLESSISVTARAQTYNGVVQFKNALSANPKFSDVTLPLTSVAAQPDATVGFTVSFKPKTGEW